MKVCKRRPKCFRRTPFQSNVLALQLPRDFNTRLSGHFSMQLQGIEACQALSRPISQALKVTFHKRGPLAIFMGFPTEGATKCAGILSTTVTKTHNQPQSLPKNNCCKCRQTKPELLPAECKDETQAIVKDRKI
eukprot:3166119-Amphidinium_carterae.1